jgi:hypothetical protein
MQGWHLVEQVCGLQVKKDSLRDEKLLYTQLPEAKQQYLLDKWRLYPPRDCVDLRKQLEVMADACTKELSDAHCSGGPQVSA